MILIENSVYQYEVNNETIFERILWIDRKKNTVIVVRLSEDNNVYYFPDYRELKEYEKFIKEEALKRSVNPFDRIFDPQSAFYKDHVKKRDERWERIKSLAEDKPDIYDPSLRSKLIQELSEKTHVSTRTYYADLKLYWRGGQIVDALFPLYENSGGKGKSRIITEEMKQNALKEGKPIPKRGRQDTTRNVGINVDETTLGYIKKSIRDYYQTTNKLTLPEAYRYMLRKYFNVGHEIIEGVSAPIIDPEGRFPTLEAYKYHVYKDIDLRKTVIRREGIKRYNLSHRPVLGSSVNDQMAPGSVFQIDATQGNVYLVNRYDRERIISRPTIYIVQDVFSRFIAGSYVRMNAPSWQGVQLALLDAFKNSKIISSFGYESGETCLIPKSILPDRGSEFISLNSDNLSESILDIRVKNAPPYRADWKGMVEQHINLIKKKTRMLPGAVKKGHKERGEVDHRLDAILDIDQFTDIVKKVIETLNNRLMKEYELDELMTKDGVRPIPIELWNWGVKNRGTNLREFPEKSVIINLLPREKATVKRDGIIFQGRSYTSEVALEQQWFDKAGASGSWQVPIAYDPRNAGDLYIILENGKQIIPCQLLPHHDRYNNYTIDEIEDLYGKEKEQQFDYEIQGLQNEINLDAYLDHIVTEAIASKDIPSIPKQSNQQKLNGIEENKKLERKKENDKEAVMIQDLLQNNESKSIMNENNSLEEKIEELLSKEQSLHRKLTNF
ncbi:Mu transposase C-terminal domain-containing protein [Neobacillus soli]|uniref:Mu transposase C-terminal domain-containing protein n=1 Tax=Neobacillus soli TaxID=220688 RepID=UPI000824BDC9|nr:Mu transposase C-terminal domain-containing protein [Neobacillus soli]